jgi:hypothetical protein
LERRPPDANNMWITMSVKLINRSTTGCYSTAAKLLTDIAKGNSPRLSWRCGYLDKNDLESFYCE